MQLNLPSKLPTDLIADPALSRRVHRGRRYRFVGWGGALLSVATVAAKGLPAVFSSQVGLLVGVGFTISLLLLNWTRIWVRESREPFKYTYSVAEFAPGPEADQSGFDSLKSGLIRWLELDLTEKLGERVRRLSLRQEKDVPQQEEGEEPAPHVHISGWYGLRPTEDGLWCVEVVPKVRVGGEGAPEELGNTVRFKLEGPEGQLAPEDSTPPSLDVRQYRLLLERVYWAVASKIYDQIRRGVEQKAMLLPPGRLRAAAYLNEADDYARSNTLDAFEAARKLYRKAQEAYDRGSHRNPKTDWRKLTAGFWGHWDHGWSWLRRRLSRVVQRLGRREILAAAAQLGYARMLVAEWNLRYLCGSIPKELYEAPRHISEAIARLEGLPADIPDRRKTLFRAYVTLGLAHSDLQNPKGAEDDLRKARELLPADAAEDSEFLLTEAIIAGDPIRSLRLLTRAVERDPKHERARFMKADQLERLWRRRNSFEPSPAEVLDGEYAEVLGIDPGNVSAWSNRGYIGWLLCPPAPEHEQDSDRLSWRWRALSALDAGLRYKEVRRDAMVGELNWNLVRFRAEAGHFTSAYENYIEAVSAMLGEPRMSFVEYFYRDATEALRHRYEIYEGCVKKKAASATGKGDDRLVRSVLAFVLNDCGGAHFACSQRLGDEKSLRRSIDLFERAIDLNPSFVLPRFNLATIQGELAQDESLPSRDRAIFLNSALEHVWEVVQVEQFWTFSRLTMARLEAHLPSLRAEFDIEAAAKSPPTQSFTSPRTWLQTLMPHPYFSANGGSNRSVEEAKRVQEVLANRGIHWEKDFNEAQVAVLIAWAAMLVEPAPKEAIALSDKLQEVFHKSHPVLLDSRNRAARRLRDGARYEAERECWEGEIKNVFAQKAPSSVVALRSDPTDCQALRSFFEDLSPSDRVEILSRARHASPGEQAVRLLTKLASGLRPAVAYAGPIMSQPKLTPLAAAVLHVDRPERVLQIECGTGDGVLFLAREFPSAHIRGADSSAEAVREATGNVGLDPEGRVSFKQSRPDSLRYPEDAFDLFVAVDTRPDAGEAARVLRHGGFLVLASTLSPSAMTKGKGWLLRRDLGRRGFEPFRSQQLDRGSFAVFRLGTASTPASAL